MKMPTYKHKMLHEVELPDKFHFLTGDDTTCWRGEYIAYKELALFHEVKKASCPVAAYCLYNIVTGMFIKKFDDVYEAIEFMKGE